MVTHWLSSARRSDPVLVGSPRTEKEYLAILIAVDQWRSFLQHGEFIIFTDQRSLMHITDQRLQTPWQMKLYTKLVGLQFKVVYKPGVTNLAADALSRHPQPPV
jgi:hypothetical protein